MYLPQSKSGLAQFFFYNTNASWLWLFLRLYIGWGWLSAGYAKAMNPAWVGSGAGKGITGFLSGSLQKMNGEHPDVSFFYGYFIQHIALPNAVTFSYLIVFGEIAVGIALILGIFTGVAAFFGATMNFNFMFAGSVSINPYFILAEIFLILAWRVSGYIGLDRYVIPFWRRLSRTS